MMFEMADHVSGLSGDQIARAAAEAERGHDLDGRPGEPNPHTREAPSVPTDLLDEIVARAEHDGESPQELVRRALVRYLRSA
ncbi:hypothetical protein [Nocardioides sp. AE5]|uniref:hypothetical protein n=1 Tax=Nocardioides sp. AE5 TaxID=2962573 RepID=UPI0028811C07|nr:hypothetical protein [Nocardioides sp. AE5]MDT0200835.1 hypothetical protein [Nocardioides sp. AE5]